MQEDKGEPNKKVSFWLKQSQYDIMERLARERGDDAVAGVMREAVAEYIERRENPNIVEEQVLRAIEKNPHLLEKHVLEIIQRLGAQQVMKSQ